MIRATVRRLLGRHIAGDQPRKRMRFQGIEVLLLMFDDQVFASRK